MPSSATRICVYYPFAISLSSPYWLAVFTQWSVDADAVQHEREYSDPLLTTGAKIQAFKRNKDMFQRLKVPLGFARYVFQSIMRLLAFRYVAWYKKC